MSHFFRRRKLEPIVSTQSALAANQRHVLTHRYRFVSRPFIRTMKSRSTFPCDDGAGMHGRPALIGTRWTPDQQSQKIHDHAPFHPDHDGPHSSQGTERASRIAPP